MGKTLYSHLEDYNPFDSEVQDAGAELLKKEGGRLPARIRRYLDRSADREWALQPKASSVAWRDMLTPRRALAADGTAVTNVTAETIMCPDFTFAADYMEVGDAFKYTLFADIDTVITTPGTIIFRLRWGGVGGTILAASGAFAPDPTAAATAVSVCVEWYVVVRSVGTAGSMFCMGKIAWNDFDDATVTTLKGNLDMQLAPVSAPAAVGSLNTTTANALSPTVQFSVATATTELVNHIAILESLN